MVLKVRTGVFYVVSVVGERRIFSISFLVVVVSILIGVVCTSRSVVCGWGCLECGGKNGPVGATTSRFIEFLIVVSHLRLSDRGSQFSKSSMKRRGLMTSICVLKAFLLVRIGCAFNDGTRWFGIGGLLIIVVVTGAIWGAHIPLA